jgi:hypothetical protein
MLRWRNEFNFWGKESAPIGTQVLTNRIILLARLRVLFTLRRQLSVSMVLGRLLIYDSSLYSNTPTNTLSITDIKTVLNMF